MTKYLFITVALFTCASSVLAQSNELLNNKPFRFDDYKDDKNVYKKYIGFTDSNNMYKDTLRYDRKYKYVLINVNRFVYKEATAEQKGENLNIEIPEIFKTIKLPPSFSKQSIIPNPTGQVSQVQGVVEANSEKKPCTCDKATKIIDSNKYEALQQNAKSFTNTLKQFYTYSTLNREMEKLKVTINLTFSFIIKTKINFIKDSLCLIVSEKDLNDNITAKYKELQRQAESIFNTQILPVAVEMIDTIEKVIKDLNKCFYCVDTCRQRFAEPTQSNNPYYALKDCVAELQSFAAEMSESLKSAKSSIAGTYSAFAEGKIDALQKNYNLLAHENFELELQPFIADKDVHEITFTTGAEGPLEFGLPAKRTIKIKAITTGGWKIDYSTGAFFNVGSNKFLGPQYYFENRKSDTTKAVIEAQRTKKAMLSIGALMHIYLRINSFFRPALTFGVSTTLGFDVLNFHGGFSLLLGKPGKANRVIISGGITWREVSLLDSRFKLNEFRNDYGDAVPTSKNFPVSGGFFSLSYNLSNINK